jgi:mannose-1-phosphate guanylyltransferase
MRYAMIMAGGSGTRLWPVSRQGLPKQLIRFIDRPGRIEAASLLELSAERLEGLVERDHRFICTGEAFRDAIRQRLPDFGDEQILGEPMGRDTVNAVGLTAAVLAGRDPEAVFAVLTADHLIEPIEVFHRAVETGFALVEADASRLVTFGIKPTFAATGFGYVEQAADLSGTNGLGFGVARFVEKPGLPDATRYVESGRFFWNAGMFVFHARTFLRLLEQHAPDNSAGLARIAAAWDTPSREAVLNEVYPTLPKISVDYAIMEPASSDASVSICGVRMDVQWLDVGSWPAYGETIEPDEDDNRVSGPGRAIFEDSRSNLVVTSGGSAHTVSLLGCEGLIVVQTPDATLVMPRERAQDLKKLHEQVPPNLK